MEQDTQDVGDDGKAWSQDSGARIQKNTNDRLYLRPIGGIAMRIHATACWLATACVAANAQNTPPVIVLDCEAVRSEEVALKLIVMNVGLEWDDDVELLLNFREVGDEGEVLELPGPGFRTTSVPIACSRWAPDHVEVLRLGRFAATEATPREVEVTATLGEAREVVLGKLVRVEGEGGPMVLQRACPEAAEGERRIIAAAACEWLDEERFLVKVAYLNCGERLDRDYWAFLHFEPEPTGENLAVTAEMGLHPSGQPTDAASWAEAEVTVVTFGSYSIPAELDSPIYVRVGLYDHDGDGHRVRMVGSGERDRVLVGRLVPSEDGLAFERLRPGEEVAP